MVSSKGRRRQVMLAWIGIGVAWGASSLVAFVLVADGARLVGATTVVALAVGVLVTRRLTSLKDPRAQITVRDLRGDRLRRR